MPYKSIDRCPNRKGASVIRDLPYPSLMNNAIEYINLRTDVIGDRILKVLASMQKINLDGISNKNLNRTVRNHPKRNKVK